MNRRVVISGCSGGGKSTLVDALGRAGYGVVTEPGRRIITEERRRGGRALPWIDAHAFVRRAVAMSRNDIEGVSNDSGWVFFDRGLVDAASALSELSGEPIADILADKRAYHRRVFLAPPWPEIYVNDADRRHPLSSAMQEYDRLVETYPTLGYDVVMLPKVSVVQRVAFVLQQLGAASNVGTDV